MMNARLQINRRFAIVLLIIAGPLAERCLAGKLRVEIGPGADFARYKTYQWLPPKVLTSSGVVENEPVIGPAMKDAINRQLSGKGLREVAEGGDLQVSALALREAIPQLEAVVFGGPEMMYAEPIATMGRYNHEGTLIVNLIDTRTKKSAWVGMAKETIDRGDGTGLKKLPAAAAKLFKKYPSPKK
jgi:hypothetical protein